MATAPTSFDTSRISFGEMIAGASALALLIFMTILPWFEIGTSEDEDEFDDAVDQLDLDITYNAWEAFGFIDIILLLIALATLAYVVARTLDVLPVLPIAPGLIIAGLGALAVLLILFRIIVTPNLEFEFAGQTVNVKDEEDGEVNRKIFGLLLGLLSAAGIAFGGFTASKERGGGGPRPGGQAISGAPGAGAPGAVGAGTGPAGGGQPPTAPTQAAPSPGAGAPGGAGGAPGAAAAETPGGAAGGGGQPAPDWYPDPKGEARLRYWDGSQWTDQTAD